MTNVVVPGMVSVQSSQVGRKQVKAVRDNINTTTALQDQATTSANTSTTPSLTVSDSAENITNVLNTTSVNTTNVPVYVPPVIKNPSYVQSSGNALSQVPSANIGWGSQIQTGSGWKSGAGYAGGFYGTHPIPPQIALYSKGLANPLSTEPYFNLLNAWASVIYRQFVLPTMAMLG